MGSDDCKSTSYSPSKAYKTPIGVLEPSYYHKIDLDELL